MGEAMTHFIRLGVLSLACVVAAGAAQAQSARVIDRVRAGVNFHGVGGPEKHTFDLTGEAITSKLGSDPSSALNPALHFGTNVNLSGKTTAIYGGATFGAPISGPVFWEGDLGLALHNGKKNAGDRANLGSCNFGFRGQALVGYQVTQQIDVDLAVEHFNGLGVCGSGAGLTNIGTKLGYKF